MHKLVVLVAGHDMGGINLLRPLLRQWSTESAIEAHFLGDPSVTKEVVASVPGVVLAEAGAPLSDWTSTRSDELDAYLDRLLMNTHFDAVLCGTSAHALLERRVIAAAQRHSVVSVAYCDMWWAYVERFSDGTHWTLPDRLWVIDQEMGRQAESAPWPRALSVDVIGSTLFAERQSRSASVGTVGNAIRFISEPASTKFPEVQVDEFIVADGLAHLVADLGHPQGLIVRPHPTESMEAWRRWSYARRALGVSLDPLPLEEAIADTSHAIGLSSMLLAEMAISGVRVASVQLPPARADYFCLPFAELGISVLSSSSSVAEWIQSGDAGPPPSGAIFHSRAIERATQALLAIGRDRR